MEAGRGMAPRRLGKDQDHREVRLAWQKGGIDRGARVLEVVAEG